MRGARNLWLASVLAALPLLAACHHTPKSALPVGNDTDGRNVQTAGTRHGNHDPEQIDGHLVASLDQRVIGPFYATRGDDGVVAYIGTVDDGARALVAVAVDGHGVMKADAQRLVTMKDDATKLVVKGLGGNGSGFAAVWSSIAERGESVYLAGINTTEGKLRGPVIELSHTNDHIVWLDVVPTTAGAVCVWAEEARAGGASLFAASIDPDGKLRGSPSRIIRSVQAWQTVPTADGVGIAIVTRVDSHGRDEGDTGGALSFLRLDASAHTVDTPIAVTAKPEVGGDIDVVRNGDRYVFAWTDRSEADPYVAVARIDEQGRVTPPTRAVIAPTGGSSLVALKAGTNGVALAWDEPLKRGRATRRVHLQRLDAAYGGEGTEAAKLGGTTLEIAGRDDIDLTDDGDGFGLLVTASACRASTDPPAPVSCTDAPLPTFVRFDHDLVPNETIPLRLGTDHVPAALAWNLSCHADRCTALTVDAASPAQVRVADITPRKGPYVPPLAPTPPAGAPIVESLTTLAAGAMYTSLAATKLGHPSKPAPVPPAIASATGKPGAPAAATPSSATPRPNPPAGGAPPSPKPTAPPQPGNEAADTLVVAMSTNADASGGGEATVSVIPVDARGVAGAPVPISARAVLAGGLAIASAARADDGAAVAWVARDGGDLQVHVSRVDRRGRRVNDVMLTSARGDASDVTIGWAGNGWIVAWVDGRDGNGEVYATKVGLDLGRIAREERITTASGDASDLALLANDNDSWLAWSDPREDDSSGTSDVYVARIHSRDAKKYGTEVRALASTANSRSPILAAAGPSEADGALVAWIEDAPMGGDPTREGAHGAMLLSFESNGQPHGEPVRMQAAGPGLVTGVTLAPNDDGDVRAILARSERDDLLLDVMEIGSARSSVRATPLLTLDAPASFDVTMALANGVLYFDDDGAPSVAPVTGGSIGPTRHRTSGSADRRVRRATIHWTR